MMVVFFFCFEKFNLDSNNINGKIVIVFFFLIVIFNGKVNVVIFFFFVLILVLNKSLECMFFVYLKKYIDFV